ncbi:phosphonate ABC transporter ATP-binding protein [Cellulosimicrobium cellulans]|uniref:phosphonate ABC transporter ATP-binding protein n=1 Tax=Cellulosimicrobium cellulans TaxID=1710 RepID=UPI00364A948E
MTTVTTSPGTILPGATTAAGGPPPTDGPPRLPLVSVRELRVAYGDGPLVLDGVDLDLFPGEMVALLGSSGSGKSTLMKSLTGFAPVTSGSVRVNGYDLTNLRHGQLRGLRASVGQVFQQFNLVGRLSVLTNVLTGALHDARPLNLGGGFTGAHRTRALELLDRVGIAHKATDQARTLSGGQQQRVAIARALMQRPRLILADEPVASLDPTMSRSVLDLLHRIAREDGIPVLVSLHVLPLALAHSDRIVGLRHGETLVSAPTRELDAASLDVLYAHDEEGGDHDADVA